jgi:hypothetical protein
MSGAEGWQGTVAWLSRPSKKAASAMAAVSSGNIRIKLDWSY